jgi:hypothetical protein
MHPRQASLLTQVTELTEKTAAKRQSEKKQGLGQPILWKYTDPDGGQNFYLEEKKMTIKSPYTGKVFSSRPERHTPAQVGKEMKDDAKTETPKMAAVDPWKA